MKNKKNLTKSILENIDSNIIKNKNTYKLQDLKNDKSMHREKNIKNNEIKNEYDKCKSINKKNTKYYKSKSIKNVDEIEEINSLSKVNKKIDKSEADNSAFIMVPINHPKINEIMNLLNDNQNTANTKNIVSNNINLNNEISNLNINQNQNKNEQPENITRLIITLNDILNNYNQDELIIPKYSIITPLARDYIKQKKMKVIYA